MPATLCIAAIAAISASEIADQNSHSNTRLLQQSSDLTPAISSTRVLLAMMVEQPIFMRPR
jgi:hypothetical protein